MRLISSNLVSFLAINTLLLLAGPVCAQDLSRWTVRGFGEWLSPDIDPVLVPDVLPFAITFEGEDDLGFGAAVEYRFSRRLGVELSVGRTEPEIALALIPTLLPADFPGRLTVTRVGVALPVHLTPDAPVDVWLAPSLSFFQFGDLEFASLGGPDSTLSGGDDLALGAQIGLDIPLGGGRWGIHLGGAYHDAQISLTSASSAAIEGKEIEIDFDPVVVRAGFSLRL